eukprot:1595662-Prorocentrum_lima.AAC.1
MLAVFEGEGGCTQQAGTCPHPCTSAARARRAGARWWVGSLGVDGVWAWVGCVLWCGFLCEGGWAGKGGRKCGRWKG